MSEYFSEEGLEKLKQELEELKTVKRHEIAARLEHAKSLGDLSENAEYQEAREEQSLLESQIVEIEEVLRNAVIIKKDAHSSLVQVGSTVGVASEHGEENFTIVGSEEADPKVGKISNESPLGKTFLGHKVGEKVEVKTPGGIIHYSIIAIG